MKKQLNIILGILIFSMLGSYPCFAYEKEIRTEIEKKIVIKDSKTEDENKTTLSQFYEEVFHQGKVDNISKFISADAIDHDIPPGVPQGLDSIKHGISMFLAGFPDMHFQVEDMIAKGDKVVARVSFSGTHKGNFMGISPTGKTVKGTAVDIVTFRNGKMVEHWSEQNMLPFLEQLGFSLQPPGK